MVKTTRFSVSRQLEIWHLSASFEVVLENTKKCKETTVRWYFNIDQCGVSIKMIMWFPNTFAEFLHLPKYCIETAARVNVVPLSCAKAQVFGWPSATLYKHVKSQVWPCSNDCVHAPQRATTPTWKHAWVRHGFSCETALKRYNLTLGHSNTVLARSSQRPIWFDLNPWPWLNDNWVPRCAEIPHSMMKCGLSNTCILGPKHRACGVRVLSTLRRVRHSAYSEAPVNSRVSFEFCLQTMSKLGVVWFAARWVSDAPNERHLRRQVSEVRGGKVTWVWIKVSSLASQCLTSVCHSQACRQPIALSASLSATFPVVASSGTKYVYFKKSQFWSIVIKLPCWLWVTTSRGQSRSTGKDRLCGVPSWNIDTWPRLSRVLSCPSDNFQSHLLMEPKLCATQQFVEPKPGRFRNLESKSCFFLCLWSCAILVLAFSLCAYFYP